MEKLINEVQKMMTAFDDLKKTIHENQIERQFDEWIPRKVLMTFLDYGDTQMASLLKSGNLKVAEIGNRKFIHKPSVIRFLEKNVRM